TRTEGRSPDERYSVDAPRAAATRSSRSRPLNVSPSGGGAAVASLRIGFRAIGSTTADCGGGAVVFGPEAAAAGAPDPSATGPADTGADARAGAGCDTAGGITGTAIGAASTGAPVCWTGRRMETVGAGGGAAG